MKTFAFVPPRVFSSHFRFFFSPIRSDRHDFLSSTVKYYTPLYRRIASVFRETKLVNTRCQQVQLQNDGTMTTRKRLSSGNGARTNEITIVVFDGDSYCSTWVGVKKKPKARKENRKNRGARPVTITRTLTYIHSSLSVLSFEELHFIRRYTKRHQFSHCATSPLPWLRHSLTFQIK